MKAFSGAIFFIGLCLFTPLKVGARTFDFKSERFAPYIGGTYGLSQVSDSAYEGSSGNGGVSTDQKVSMNMSGEIGFIFPSERFNFKLGLEFLAPKFLTGVNGTSSSGTNYFSLDSTLYATVPMATIEFLAFRTSESHMIIGIGGGMAFLTLENNYTMTAAGTTALGVGNTDEKGTGQAPAGQVYLGYEFLISDTATIAFNVGYRYIQFSQINSSQTLSAPSGSETSGQALVNMDGSNRTVNLSGPFGGLSLRFYFGG
jgi:hypothetical protein